MPRKDKKSKKPKKPKAVKIITRQLKPCLDCGNKTGSAFTIPFGYADRFGTQRLSVAAPIVNINLADYFKMPVEKKEMSIQTEQPLALAMPEEEDFGIVYNEPFVRNNFIPVEPAVPSTEPTSKKVGKIGGIRILGPGPILRPAPAPVLSPMTVPSEFATSVGSFGATTAETVSTRHRRTNVEIYTELLIQDGYQPNNAMALAKSVPKEQLRERIDTLKVSLGKQKKI